jgi:VWA domain-containing protein/HEAT repeat protein/PBS lyase HEAT-like repeat-containing protein
VAFFDTRDAAKLLLSGVSLVDRLMAPMIARKAEVDEKIERYLGGIMMDEQRTLPAEAHAAVKTLKRESGRLQDEITGEMGVLQAIEDGLRSMRNEEAIRYLYEKALGGEKSWKARQIVAASLTDCEDPDAVKYLIRALKDKDDRVRMSVAVTLGKLKAAPALKGLVALLKDNSWTVRSAAIEALGDIGEKGAVGPLIEQITKEEGRLKEDCGRALKKLTGQNFGSVDDAWRRWWEEHKAEYGGDGLELGGHPVGRGGSDGGYYGIPIETHRAIFVVDVSGSMGEIATGQVTKIESAKNELVRVVKNFSSDGHFNVIVFNDIVKAWKDRMMPANKANKAAGTDWVKALTAASSTNIYDALEKAFQIAGMGATDKNYALGADTIFLLSDGSPTKPDGGLDDWEKIIRAVREWNRLKRITVHTIGIGGHNVAFMATLASENGGTYVAR